jgi:predicted DNA binding CopG/RHH family protein
MIEYIDQEEKEIIELLHSKEWQPNPDKSLNKIYEDYARYCLELNRKIEVSLMDRDFYKIQIKALEEGIPYQSMISMLIHKFNEGKIAITT